MDALTAAQMGTIALEMPSETRTAEQAAEVASCEIDQIAKSIIFAGSVSGDLFLFITAGGNQVDADRASAFACIASASSDFSIALSSFIPETNSPFLLPSLAVCKSKSI